MVLHIQKYQLLFNLIKFSVPRSLVLGEASDIKCPQYGLRPLPCVLQADRVLSRSAVGGAEGEAAEAERAVREGSREVGGSTSQTEGATRSPEAPGTKTRGHDYERKCKITGRNLYLLSVTVTIVYC